jgi:hypothetical protein
MDVIKVQDNLQKKLKTVQHFRKQASLEPSPFEYFDINFSLRASLHSFQVRKDSNLSDLEIYTAEKLRQHLELIDSFDFDVFEVDALVGKKTLRYVLHEIFNHYSFFEEILDADKYRSFIEKISDGYTRDVVYHNDIHATDVLQTMYVMLEKGELVNVYLYLI